MNRANIIKQQLKRAGAAVSLNDGEQSSDEFFAVVTHLWRRKSTSFESISTELGFVNPKYYLYIGPYDRDITALSDDAALILDGDTFEFKVKDRVTAGGEILYYTGVLRKTREAEE